MESGDNTVWMLGLLEAVVHRLGVQVRYDKFEDDDGEVRLRSGACRIKGRDVIIVDSRLSHEQKSAVLVEALRHLDLSDVFVPPAVRALLDD